MNSFPEPIQWNGDDTHPMPSVEDRSDYFEAYAASFEQDLRNAVEVLGWAHVNAIVSDVKADG